METMTKIWLVLAFVGVVTGRVQGIENRVYWSETLSALSSGANKHTHVKVTAKVTLVKHEQDGDLHIRLGTKPFIVAECIPKLPCMEPKLGEVITVWGIYRQDYDHKWFEVHPVERLEVGAVK